MKNRRDFSNQLGTRVIKRFGKRRIFKRQGYLVCKPMSTTTRTLFS